MLLVFNFRAHSLYDFYLVSQSVRQGTVTPIHYVVSYDEILMRPEFLQRVTYKLTHLYYNWPVSTVFCCAVYNYTLCLLLSCVSQGLTENHIRWCWFPWILYIYYCYYDGGGGDADDGGDDDDGGDNDDGGDDDGGDNDDGGDDDDADDPDGDDDDSDDDDGGDDADDDDGGDDADDDDGDDDGNNDADDDGNGNGNDDDYGDHDDDHSDDDGSDDDHLMRTVCHW